MPDDKPEAEAEALVVAPTWAMEETAQPAATREAFPDPKLNELRPEFRALLEPILVELARLGFQPKISNAYRSVEEQAKKKAQGFAKSARPGAHTWGLAADVIDRRWGWKVTEENAKFFGALCRLSVAAGLVCGGTWFGKGGTRERPTHPSPWNHWKLGWDVAHVEMRNPPAALRREYRPG